MLYLVYPERRWEDVINSYKWFKERGANSLLCREELETSPYLCLEDVGGAKGRQLTPHNYYRRQDYPQCFKVCHMVSIFKISELKHLNDNLYNKNTNFYKIPQTTDVDTFDDLERYKNKYGS